MSTQGNWVPMNLSGLNELRCPSDCMGTEELGSPMNVHVCVPINVENDSQFRVLNPLSLHSMLVTGLLVRGHTIRQLLRMIGVSAMQLTSRGGSPIICKVVEQLEFCCC